MDSSGGSAVRSIWQNSAVWRTSGSARNMFVGYGRKAEQESLRQVKIRSIPIFGEHLYDWLWPPEPIFNDYPEDASSPHEFIVQGTGYGKSLTGFERCV